MSASPRIPESNVEALPLSVRRQNLWEGLGLDDRRSEPSGAPLSQEGIAPLPLLRARTQRGGGQSTTLSPQPARGLSPGPSPLHQHPQHCGGYVPTVDKPPPTTGYTKSCKYLLKRFADSWLKQHSSFPSRSCRRGCTASALGGWRAAGEQTDTPATSLWHLLLHGQPESLYAAAFPKALEAASPSSRCRQAPCLVRDWVEDRVTELCCGGRGALS